MRIQKVGGWPQLSTRADVERRLGGRGRGNLVLPGWAEGKGIFCELCKGHRIPLTLEQYYWDFLRGWVSAAGQGEQIGRTVGEG